MPDSEKDTAAEEVAERRAIFNLALSNKRKYPVKEFRAFVQTTRRYIAMTKNDPMIHKSVARAVNGLREFLAEVIRTSTQKRRFSRTAGPRDCRRHADISLLTRPQRVTRRFFNM